MSVYDFNKHEFVTNHHHHLQHNNYIVGPSHYQNQSQSLDSNGNNCQAIARYQVENSYLNRGVGAGSLGGVANYPTSTQHMDMSLPTTRPTSKTAMLVRQRRAMLEQLSCYLCKGFLIDATTVDECMDSFCKSCIVKHLREYNDCPKCHTTIHKTNPLSSIRSDKVLQDIVYKLIPGLYDDEMKRRREFYKGVLGTTNTSSDDDDDTSSSSFTGKNSNMSSEQYGIVSHPKPFYKPTDVIKISIEPHTKDDCSDIYYDNKRQSIVTCFTTGNAKNSITNNNQQQKSHQQRPINWSIFSTVDKSQFKTYLRCEAKLTALHLKKFIAAKFNASKDDTVHLLYWNETVQEDYSLIDIAYIYDWRGIEHMRLFFIIERDLSNMNDQKDQFVQQSDGIEFRKVKLSRQSVATSTQPIKRVCIDPHPQYYDETTSKRHTFSSNTNGRNMRSKQNETAGSFATRSTSTAAIQAPILRSSGGSYTGLKSNGHSSASTSRVALGSSGSSRETRQQTSAIEELNRAKQARENEARTKRKNASIEKEATSSYIPNMNASRSSSSLRHESDTSLAGDRSVSSYTRSNGSDCGGGGGASPAINCVQQKLSSTIEQYQEPIATTASNYRQLVPSVNSTKCSMLTTKAGSPAQSSVVTLASFTEARSNHVMSMTTSSATAITNSYRNMMGIGTGGGGSGSFKPMDTRTVNSSQAVMAQEMRPQSNSTQVAFSFVTERGITIVRRLPQRDSPSSTTTLSSNQTSATQQASNSQISRLNACQQLPALPAPPSTSQSSQPPRATLTTTNSGESGSNHHQQQQQQKITRCVSQLNKPLSNQVSFSSPPTPKATSGTQASGGNSSGGSGGQSSDGGGIGTTARHLIKVKPVYKTFVDPTKLKTPNLKKLGFTARH